LSPIACRRYAVSGKVQGVFFRAGTAREAAALDLTGWAMNLPDGRVEVLALGLPEQLAALEKWLAHGPATARVDAVMVHTEDPDEFQHLVDFRTR